MHVCMCLCKVTSEGDAKIKIANDCICQNYTVVEEEGCQKFGAIRKRRIKCKRKTKKKKVN